VRQIVLDTETTGLEVAQGHRIIEIGCVELVNRRRTGNDFQRYLNPDREIDPAAQEVHGITAEMLEDKPGFEEIAAEFTDYVSGAELIIHNAEFDLGFINNEISIAGNTGGPLNDSCDVLDTLALARRMHPGQRNNLDALCRRYEIDNSRREFHGALLDAQILADVYLAMTGGQASLGLVEDRGRSPAEVGAGTAMKRRPGVTFIVRRAGPEEAARHEAQLDMIADACGHLPLFRNTQWQDRGNGT
jgi:DNA polymerase-3 subunit epsilon